MAEWLIKVSGNPDDLADLARPRTEDWHVRQRDDGYYLGAACFQELESSAQVWAAAQKFIKSINGVAMLQSANYTGIAPDRVALCHDGGGMDIFVLPNSAHEELPGRRSTLAINQDWVRLGLTNPNVAEALDIVSTRELNPTNLYKLLEIVSADVGNEAVIRDAGWASRNQLDVFARSMCHQGATGPSARHARLKAAPPPKPMSVAQARTFIFGLLRSWLASKA